MAIDIIPEKISSHFLQLIKQGRYSIHSYYESGCNIMIQDYLCFIGNKDSMELPYGIILNKADNRILYDFNRNKILEFYWDPKELQLSNNELRIPMKGVPNFSSDITAGILKITRKELHLLYMAVDDNWMTGFGVLMKQIKTGDWELLRELFDAFHKTKEESVLILKKWIGRGIGLTPSGDDFLVGILYINQLSHMLSDGFVKGIMELIGTNYTTDISVQYYCCAIEGRFSGAFLDLTKAFMDGSLEGVKTSVQKILLFGNTSGVDMLAGVMAGFLYVTRKH